MVYSKSDSHKSNPDAPPSYGESSSDPLTSELTSNLSLEKRRRPRLRARSQPEVIQQLDLIIRQSWGKGVQKHKFEDGCWEWKLSGRPWLGQHTESVPSRQLILALLTELWKCGWTLETSQLLFLHSLDRDSLFFKQIPVSGTSRTFFGISFAEMDKVRVYGCPSEIVSSAITSALRTWSKGLQEEREKEPGYYQYKLRGQPWLTYDQAQVIDGRQVVCELLSALEGVSYDLVGSVDMTIGNDGRDGDTLFFGSRV